MDVKKFFEAIAVIISAREGVTVKVKSIKKIKEDSRDYIKRNVGNSA